MQLFYERLQLYCAPQNKLYDEVRNHIDATLRVNKISSYQKYYENVYACIEKNNNGVYLVLDVPVFLNYKKCNPCPYIRDVGCRHE